MKITNVSRNRDPIIIFAIQNKLAVSYKDPGVLSKLINHPAKKSRWLAHRYSPGPASTHLRQCKGKNVPISTLNTIWKMKRGSRRKTKRHKRRKIKIASSLHLSRVFFPGWSHTALHTLNVGSTQDATFPFHESKGKKRDTHWRFSSVYCFGAPTLESTLPVFRNSAWSKSLMKYSTARKYESNEIKIFF